MKKIKYVIAIFVLFLSIGMYDFGCSNLTIRVDALESDYDFSITYNLNGGINDINNPQGYNEKNKIKLNKPIKEGYIFQGWYMNEALTKKINGITKSTKGDITLYAKWSPITYTIKFNGNRATNGKMSALTKRKYDTEYILKNNSYKKKGYTFVEWNTNKDGTGISYKNGEKFKNVISKNNGSLVLYAIWKRDNYKITYELNGGVESLPNVTSYTVTDSIVLNKPTKKGYVFKGWYSNESLTKKVSKIKKGMSNDLTLYAKWSPVTYTIKFNGNRATSGKMSALTKRKYDTEYNLKNNSYKKKGYTFIEWNANKDGAGISFKNGDTIKNLLEKNNSSITLYAIWKQEIYNINYELFGGKLDTPYETNYTITDKITLPNPKKNGYIFKGWYSNKSLTKRMTSIKKGTTGDITLYAKWQKSKE